MGGWVDGWEGGLLGGPMGGVFDHHDKLPQDLIVAVVEFPPGLDIEIVAFDSKLKPNLSFSCLCLTVTDLRDERCFVTTLALRFP